MKQANPVYQRAIFDPILLVHLLLADLSALEDVEGELRPVPQARILKAWQSACFVFDPFVGLPIIVVGLPGVLGRGFLETSGPTLKKLQESGFVDFSLGDCVPEGRRPLLDSIMSFLKAADKETRGACIHSANEDRYSPLGLPTDQMPV